MNRSIFFRCILLFGLSMGEILVVSESRVDDPSLRQIKSQDSQASAINLNINFSGGNSIADVNNSPRNDVALSSSNNAKADNVLKVELDLHCLQNITLLLQAITDSAQQKSVTLLSELYNHKFTLLLAVCATAYGYLWYKIRAVHSLLASKTSWCNWKEVVALPTLMSTPQQIIFTELLQEIQKQQLMRKEPLDYQQGVMHFVTEIVDELALLQWYFNMQKRSIPYGCWKLFGQSVDAVIIQEKMARLYFLIDLFVAWQLQQKNPST